MRVDILKAKQLLREMAERNRKDKMLLESDLPDKSLLEKRAKKTKKRKRRVVYGVFPPVLYPGHMGTPKSGAPYLAQPGTMAGTGPGAPSGAPAGGAPGGMHASWVPSSRVKVLHEMKKALGLLEFSGGTGAGAVSWTGFAVPNPLTVKIRQGGPTIGGPGFASDPNAPSGGVYNTQPSPGLGFSTEKGWRIWKAAQEIASRHPELPQSAIVQAAVAKAGVKIGEVDPAEMRLVEMGVEWYLTSPGALSQRDSGFGASGGSPTKVGSLGSGS